MAKLWKGYKEPFPETNALWLSDGETRLLRTILMHATRNMLFTELGEANRRGIIAALDNPLVLST